MKSNNILRLCGIGIIALTAVHASASDPELVKARQLLEKGMSRQPTANIRAIIFQKDDESDAMQQIKVEMNKNGRVRQTVLQPLSKQGIETVDDGVRSFTYLPDQRSTIVQDSPLRTSCNTAWRMSLVDKNYKLQVDGKKKIAGRTAMVIAAIPKWADVETRRYSIDEKTGFLLKLETSGPANGTVVHFETKMIEYPGDISTQTFQMRTAGTNTVRYERRKTFEDAEGFRKEVGFAPVVPPALPYGFAVQEVQTNSNAKLQSVVVRLTDGLAQAAVYQWQNYGVKRTKPAPEGTTVADAGPLRVLISGDVPAKLREKLLQAFVAAQRSGEQGFKIPKQAFRWIEELLTAKDLFPGDIDLKDMMEHGYSLVIVLES